MKAIRIPEGTWRPDSVRLYHFGTYRVPEDMPAELAQRAVADGVAEVVSGDADSAAEDAPATAEGVKRKRRSPPPA